MGIRFVLGGFAICYRLSLLRRLFLIGPLITVCVWSGETVQSKCVHKKGVRIAVQKRTDCQRKTTYGLFRTCLYIVTIVHTKDVLTLVGPLDVPSCGPLPLLSFQSALLNCRKERKLLSINVAAKRKLSHLLSFPLCLSNSLFLSPPPPPPVFPPLPPRKGRVPRSLELRSSLWSP